MRAIIGGVVAAGFVAVVAPAQAQAQAQVVPGDGEIVVTAQLREQKLIDVPAAVSTLSGDQLDRLGLDEFEEAARFIPGFSVQNQSPNNPGFVMRGITSDSGTAYNEPRVSVFQDGVSISKSRGSYVELFDMQRIEAAKGPQSTLYGRAALIGAVNLIQNKADPRDYAGYVSGSYGNFDAWTAEAMLNAPLGDDVAVRVAGRVRKADGYVPNLLGGRAYNSDDTRAGRAAFHAKTGGLTFDLIGNYQKDTPTGTSFKSIAYRPTDPITGAVLGTAGRNSGAALAPGAGFEGGKDLGLNREVWGVTGLATLDLGGGLALTSISAYRRFDALEVFDADGLSLPVLTAAEDARGRQTSQELRLRYEKGPLTAFFGGSYFHETGSQRVPTQFDERAVLGAADQHAERRRRDPRPARDRSRAKRLVRQYGVHRPVAAGCRGGIGRGALRRAGTGDRRQSQARASRDQHQLRTHDLVRFLRRRDLQGERAVRARAQVCAGAMTTRPRGSVRRCSTGGRSSAASSAR
jgi:iron complex outermembrane receptor protein